MSVGGPSALGTLLVQRLDAVLGTTLSQQTNLASGARPDAVSQPGQALSPDPAQNPASRDARTAVDRTVEQAGQHLRQATEKAKLDAQQGLLAGRNQASTSSTPSAPTLLGAAARTILALLTSYPDQAPALTGRSPLLSTPPDGGGMGAAQAGGRTSAPGTSATPASAGTPASGPAPQSAASASGGTAMAPGQGPGGTAALFAQALSHTLQTSGLFYESHLGSLAFGQQSLAALRAEPQALLSGSTAAGTPGAGAGQPNPAATEAAARPSSPAPDAQGPGTQASHSSAGGALAGLHPETHLLVRQQLEVLANQTIAWRGEAWPDAPMHWEVKREQSRSGEYGDDDETSHWTTQLTLVLPYLGEVQARISLAGRQLGLHLMAPRSASLLDENQEALRAQLLARGLPVGAMSIQQAASATETPAATMAPSAKAGAQAS